MNFNKAKFELGLQKDIRDEKTRISGRFKDEFDTLLKKSFNLTRRLEDTEDGKVNEKAIMKKASKLDIKKEKIQKFFKDGLKYNIKASYKIGLLDKNSSNDDIEAVIGACTLTFRSSLSSFEKERARGNNETPKTILEIIKKMYLLSPNVVGELREKYQDDPDVDERMIKKFTINNPTDPAGAIDKAVKKIGELREKYQDDPDVDDEMIGHCAVSNPFDPEGAINKAVKKIGKLREKYQDDPDVDGWIIKKFAVHNPSDPEGAIAKAVKKIGELREKYQDDPDVDDKVIKRAAIGNPSNPEGAIAKRLKKRK